MTPAEIDAIVVMPKGEYEELVAALTLAEQQAYANYHGVFAIPEPGTPQAVTLGSMIGGFIGQERWNAARRRLDNVKLCRTPSTGMSIGWRHQGNGVYRLVGINDAVHQIEIVTHGVNVDECRTPTEAILKIQAAFANQ